VPYRCVISLKMALLMEMWVNIEIRSVIGLSCVNGLSNGNSSADGGGLRKAWNVTEWFWIWSMIR